MPLIPITLFRGKESTMPFFAMLDSGADGILMHSDFASALGIEDIKTGTLDKTLGIGNQIVDVYYHDDIEIQIVGDSRKLKTRIGFIESTEPRQIIPLLGRTFFKHFKAVIFEENNERIELKV
jgi:hypothetical protein